MATSLPTAQTQVCNTGTQVQLIPRGSTLCLLLLVNSTFSRTAIPWTNNTVLWLIKITSLLTVWFQWLQWWSACQETWWNLRWVLWSQRHTTLWRCMLWGIWPRVQPPQLSLPQVCHLEAESHRQTGSNDHSDVTGTRVENPNIKEQGCNMFEWLMKNVCCIISHCFKWAVCLDVDAPQDLTASNIQTENAMLTWKPPRADITGYILSFESAEGTIRVSKNHTESGLTGLDWSGYNVFLPPGGGPEPHCWIVQHGPAQRLHRVFSEAAGHRWSQEKQSHHHCVHHQWVHSCLMCAYFHTTLSFHYIII